MLGLALPEPTEALSIARLAQEYAYTDTDGDGLVSAEELRAAFKEAMDVDIPADVVDAAVVPVLDLNSDGKLRLEEFLRALALMRPADEDMWFIMDRDGDRFVTLPEMKKAVGDVGEMGQALVEWQFRRADRLRDGRLSVNEWLVAMREVKAGLLGAGGGIATPGTMAAAGETGPMGGGMGGMGGMRGMAGSGAGMGGGAEGGPVRRLPGGSLGVVERVAGALRERAAEGAGVGVGGEGEEDDEMEEEMQRFQAMLGF